MLMHVVNFKEFDGLRGQIPKMFILDMNSYFHAKQAGSQIRYNFGIANWISMKFGDPFEGFSGK